MNKPDRTALLCINEAGEATARFLRQQDPELVLFRKEENCTCTDFVAPLFREFDGLVFFCATGIAVRLIAPFLRDKYTDPAVVVVDNGCRHVISLLSGHEGGANSLSFYIAGLCGAEPVVTTATEARKCYTLGIGSRAGIDQETVVRTVTDILGEAGIPVRQIRLASTIPAKYREQGLRAGLAALSLSLIRIEEKRIAAFAPAFRPTAASRHLAIPAVAEPCALLAARDGELVVPLKKRAGLTLAVARERLGPV